MLLNFDEKTGRFVLTGSSYAQREIPKGAGFRWDGDARQWWTDKTDVAKVAADFATVTAGAAHRIENPIAQGNSGQFAAPRHQSRQSYQRRPQSGSYATAAMAPRAAIVGSPQQTDFWHAVEFRNCHIMLQARAGTGKTFSIIEAARRLPHLRVGFSAFNASIAAELKDKVPSNAKAFTLHSLGFAAACNHFGAQGQAPEVDDQKVDKIIESLVTPEYFVNRGNRLTVCSTFKSAVKGLVSLCKSHLYDGTDVSQLEELVARHSVDTDPSDEEIARRTKRGEVGEKPFNMDEAAWQAEILKRYTDRLFGLVPVVLKKTVEYVETMDYDDMIYWPVVMKLRVRTYDVLLVDEAQDMNLCQQKLAFMACPTGRIIIVGDDRQSIYAFRGADTRSMERMREQLAETPAGCEVYPLTATRRCPKKVVELARKIVPDIEAMPDAPEGEVEHVEVATVAAQATCEHMVICRTNAPLVRVAYELIRLGKRPNLKGRDLGKRLRGLVERLTKRTPDEEREEIAAEMRAMEAASRGETVEQVDEQLAEVMRLAKKVNEYAAVEVAKLKAEDKPLSRIEAVQDDCATIEVLLEGCKSLVEFDDKLRDIFETKATPDAVPLCSVHGSKGLEADTVFILNPDDMPHPMASTPEDMEQEQNIIYVALTRTKRRLVFAYNPMSKVFQAIKAAEAKQVAAQVRATSDEYLRGCEAYRLLEVASEQGVLARMNDAGTHVAFVVPPMKSAPPELLAVLKERHDDILQELRHSKNMEATAPTGDRVIDAANAVVDSLNAVGEFYERNPEVRDRHNALLKARREGREAHNAELARRRAEEGETWQQQARQLLSVLEELVPYDQLEVLSALEDARRRLPR